jgi:hypothetical protein
LVSFLSAILKTKKKGLFLLERANSNLPQQLISIGIEQKIGTQNNGMNMNNDSEEIPAESNPKKRETL